MPPDEYIKDYDACNHEVRNRDQDDCETTQYPVENCILPDGRKDADGNADTDGQGANQGNGGNGGSVTLINTILGSNPTYLNLTANGGAGHDIVRDNSLHTERLRDVY